MKKINFTKIVASGNDFIVIDNRRQTLPRQKAGLVRKLCAWHTGIGADGLLLLEKSQRADFKMRIFNPDGSEPEMCGNGARCISLYAWTHKIIKKTFAFETIAGTIGARIIPPGKVTITLSNPKNLNLNKTLVLNNKKAKIHSINTGVPHAILFVPDIGTARVFALGRAIRRHSRFRPQGTNANFVQVLGKNRIAVRTYERGVEQETLACGTGVSASAIVSALVHDLNRPVKAETKSGETLEIDFCQKDKQIHTVTLTGPARIVFTGSVIL